MTAPEEFSNGGWEKDFMHNMEKHPHTHSRFRVDEPSRTGSPLRRKQTSGSVTMPPELFEKLYLTPQSEVKHDLRKTFANPTPLALLGFIMACTPLACDLMGWRGSGNSGIASIGAYYFMGGLLMFFGGVLEFFLGNTFAFVVFCSFGGFWFSLGATYQPVVNIAGYATAAPGKDAGLNDPGFQASYAFYMLFMGLLCMIYLICALRTNFCFVLIFFGLFMEFVLEAAEYWQLAQGNVDVGNKLRMVAGGFSFLACVSGWYIFFAQMLEALDYIIVLPVGDLSHLIRGASQPRVPRCEHNV
ncbi:MAG: hypothetical protein M4579_003693 [Chaenotheca gracillima]|nr:MAG: hypothetical protein M4579_003693 [Chaenotheca gracillima]